MGIQCFPWGSILSDGNLLLPFVSQRSADTNHGLWWLATAEGVLNYPPPVTRIALKLPLFDGLALGSLGS